MTAFQGPPRACPYCLVGACHHCTGRLTVLNAAGTARSEACEHQHRQPVRAHGIVPAADILQGVKA